MNFDFQFFIKLFPSILKYLPTTLVLSVGAILLGLIFSFIIAISIHKKIPFLTGFFRLYISFFRGTPLIAQLFLFYFGIIPSFRFLVGTISSFESALIALSFASSAYMAESLRAALSAVHIGQFEAAQSVGMPYNLMMRRIIIPQAFKVAVPTLFSTFMNIVKDTSLVFTIGVKEMMAQAQLEGSSGYRYLEAYAAVLLIFWGITSILGRVQIFLERKLGEQSVES